MRTSSTSRVIDWVRAGTITAQQGALLLELRREVLAARRWKRVKFVTAIAVITLAYVAVFAELIHG